MKPAFHTFPRRDPSSVPLFRELLGSLFSVLFPASCRLCAGELADAGGIGVCRACWEKVESWQGAVCAHCGLPFASPEAERAEDVVCAKCRQGEYAFDLGRSFGLYRGSLRGLILLLKFRRSDRLAEPLGALLVPVWISTVGDVSPESAVIVPVPLYRSRERERGFNQAELLARGLQHGLKKAGSGRAPRVESGLLRRIKPTLPQTGLTPRMRQENVHGAFAVSSPERVRDRLVVLVDDVMTTGATLSACGAALRRAGASQIVALTLARTSPQFPDSGSPPIETPVDAPTRE